MRPFTGKHYDFIALCSSAVHTRSRVLQCPSVGIAKRTFSVVLARRAKSSDSETTKQVGDYSESSLDAKRASGSTTRKPKKLPPRQEPWSAEEVQTLKEAHGQGLSIRAILDRLPKRSLCSAKEALARISHGREVEIQQLRPHNNRVPWSTTDKQRVRELYQQGVGLSGLCNAFPDRSYNSLAYAMITFGAHSSAETVAPQRRWTPEECDYLTEASSHGLHATTVARKLNRSVASVRKKCASLRLALDTQSPAFSLENDLTIVQMRKDGRSNRQIAAVLGRTLDAIDHRWLSIRPNEDFDFSPDRRKVKLNKLANSPDGIREVKDLIDQGESFSAIYRKNNYGYAEPYSLKRAYNKAIKYQKPGLQTKQSF